MDQECRLIADLKFEIRSAFRGVQLGEGIGLMEGQALDNWCTKEEQQAARDKDEQYHWENISADRLRAYESSLSFLDAEGMRFHLPAFMLAEMDGTLSLGIEFTLTHAPYLPEKFSLLDNAQRHAIRRLLDYMKDRKTLCVDQEEINRSIELYWAKSTDEV